MAVAVAISLTPATASADDIDGFGQPGVRSTTFSTWGVARVSSDATSVMLEAPVTRARECLTRARLLDDLAITDEHASTELTAKLIALRTGAKTARERAHRAVSAEDREVLGAYAEDLETDIVVSEAEIAFKRKTAAENRRVARELRARAIKLVREAPISEEPTASGCERPFRFTADARKIYRIECLK